jgi:hypothetical protein
MKNEQWMNVHSEYKDVYVNNNIVDKDSKP